MLVCALSFLTASAQRLAHLLAVGCLLHVDEIDDDDPTDVAQAQLIDDHLGGLEVGLQDRFLLSLLADEAPGVHVDGGQRLGLVEDQVAARLEPHAALERLVDLGLDAEVIEDRARFPRTGRRFEPRLSVSTKSRCAVVSLRRIDPRRGHVGGEEIADGAQDDVEVLVEEGRGRSGLALLHDAAPEPWTGTCMSARISRFDRPSHAVRTMNPPPRVAAKARDDVPQALALLLVLDAPRDADVIGRRHVDDVATGQADVRCDAGALRPDRLLRDLNQDLLAARELALERLATSPSMGSRRLRGRVGRVCFRAGRSLANGLSRDIAIAGAVGLDGELLRHRLAGPAPIDLLDLPRGRLRIGGRFHGERRQAGDLVQEIGSVQKMPPSRSRCRRRRPASREARAERGPCRRCRRPRGCAGARCRSRRADRPRGSRLGFPASCS